MSGIDSSTGDLAPTGGRKNRFLTVVIVLALIAAIAAAVLGVLLGRANADNGTTTRALQFAQNTIEDMRNRQICPRNTNVITQEWNGPRILVGGFGTQGWVSINIDPTYRVATWTQVSPYRVVRAWAGKADVSSGTFANPSQLEGHTLFVPPGAEALLLCVEPKLHNGGPTGSDSIG